jgi:hypothetical protein
MLKINFIDYPSYTNEVILDNKSYIFKFVWNTRGEFWTLSILDTDKNIILSGVKFVLNYSLLSDYYHLDIPKGSLYVIDLTDNNNKIAFEDFNNERQLSLIYATEADFATV